MASRLLLSLTLFIGVPLVFPSHGYGMDLVVGGQATGGRMRFRHIQEALAVAQPGDSVTIMPGVYEESIRTLRSGERGRPIRVRSAGSRGSVVVTARGRVVTVRHRWIELDGLVLDGQYGSDDTVRVDQAAADFVLRNSEVRRSGRDLIDLAGAPGTLIDRCLIHHALNPAGGRTDAHAIAAGPVRDLVIRDSEIHTFSGDGLQVDPSRAPGGWDRVLVERTSFWLAPLAEPQNGFAAGAVVGENGIDTKTSPGRTRARLTLRNVTAHGFRNGLIANMAAFNLKENVDVIVEGATVSASEIAFRLRGGGVAAGARITAMNVVVFDVDTAFRYEDGLRELRIWNTTVGVGVARPFRSVGRPSSPPEVKNTLFLDERPAEARDQSNLAVGRDAFVNAEAHDYALAPRSPAIDYGEPMRLVHSDRAGDPRPQGRSHDAGAFEYPTVPSR